jgi:hypothetical protein
MNITIGIGNIIALCISFSTWHSIGWGLLHGLLGWFYVVYYLIRYVVF